MDEISSWKTDRFQSKIVFVLIEITYVPPANHLTALNKSCRYYYVPNQKYVITMKHGNLPGNAETIEK